jgi:hypothetical protein
MVPMKKGILIIFAILLSFTINEIFVKYIIQYPTWGVKDKIMGIRSSQNGIQNEFLPYSKYWNVEGGNKVFHRNNLGFVGIDVDTSINMKAIIVLGSSFIEAQQVPPESSAVSIFYAKIKINYPIYQVINLGYSGHDPYDSYLRLLYYEKYFHPSKVLLVLNSNSIEWLNRHNYPFNFEKNNNIGKKQSSIKTILMKYLRNHLTSFNLSANYLLNNNDNDDKKAEHENKYYQQDKLNAQQMVKLFYCLTAYQKIYLNNFVCVSVISDSMSNKIINKWCNDNKVNYIYREDISKSENCLRGSGHFNQNGNILLGNFLYDAFIKYY